MFESFSGVSIWWWNPAAVELLRGVLRRRLEGKTCATTMLHLGSLLLCNRWKSGTPHQNIWKHFANCRSICNWQTFAILRCSSLHLSKGRRRLPSQRISNLWHPCSALEQIDNYRYSNFSFLSFDMYALTVFSSIFLCSHSAPNQTNLSPNDQLDFFEYIPFCFDLIEKANIAPSQLEIVKCPPFDIAAWFHCGNWGGSWSAKLEEILKMKWLNWKRQRG